jgi:hypothetical protein
VVAQVEAEDAPAQLAPADEQLGVRHWALQGAWQGALQGAWQGLQHLMVWARPVAVWLAVAAVARCTDLYRGVPAPADQPCLACVAADLVSGATFLAFSPMPWRWMDLLPIVWQAFAVQQAVQQAAQHE